MDVLRNYRRVLLTAAAAAAILSLLAIVLLDGRLALALSQLPANVRHGIQSAVHVCEVVFAFGLTPFLYGLLLIVAGMVARWTSRNRQVSPALMFVGLSHVTARFLADILKPPFSRLRPYEALAGGQWHDTWFADVGNSFPSGHAVHFWSLFFPLMVLFPRFTLPLAILPVLVSAARVAVNDHYLSDVIASAAIAALVTCVYAVVLVGQPHSVSQPRSR